MQPQSGDLFNPEQRALLAVAELIGDPERWTRGADARGKYCEPTSALDPSASRWCLSGALQKVLGTGTAEPAFTRVWAALQLALPAEMVFKKGPIAFNDSNDHAAVLNLVLAAVDVAGRPGYERELAERERAAAMATTFEENIKFYEAKVKAANAALQAMGLTPALYIAAAPPPPKKTTWSWKKLAAFA